jgi:glucose/arabinose dehydrogenase
MSTSSSPRRATTKPGNFRLSVERLESRLALTTLAAGFSESVLAGDLATPTAMALTGDGRMFITEQTGTVRVVKNGALLTDPLLSLNVDSAGERGLLGVTVDPNFAVNQTVYVYYTTGTSPARNRVSQFTINGDRVVPGSEKVLLELGNLPTATRHNGGALHFGADGKLYIAVGDAADGQNAQSLNNLFGKVLRINRNGTIPTDNPFYQTTTGDNRAIWAMGLRNPYTMAVQPGTGKIFINDVGQSAWEEINQGVAGGNYGWPTTEGPTSDPRFIEPLFAYQRTTGDPAGFAITGGAFYNPVNRQFPSEYVGDYFFSDYGSKWIYRYDAATDTATPFAQETTSGGGPIDLRVDSDGNLLYLVRGVGPTGGELRMVRYPQGNAAPVVSTFGGDVSYHENAPQPTPVSTTAAVSDADSANFAGGTLFARLAANTHAGDRLTLNSTGNLTLAGNGVKYNDVLIGHFTPAQHNSALVVRFNAAATPESVQAVLRSVVYFNDSQNPSIKPRTVTLKVYDGDGGASLAVTKQIHVTSENDPPLLGGAATVGYQLNAARVQLAAAATVLDHDSPHFGGGRLQVRVVGGADAGNRLQLGGPFTLETRPNGYRRISLNGVFLGAITQHGEGTNPLVITFNRSVTQGIAQQLLRSIYFHTVGSNNAAQRTVEFTLADSGKATSDPLLVTVNVRR